MASLPVPGRRGHRAPPGARPLFVLAVALATAFAAGPAFAGETGAVVGRVLTSGGEGLGGATVSLAPGGPTGVTAPDGSFRLEAGPGSYLLRATHGNRTVERAVEVVAGRDTVAVLNFPADAFGPGGVDPFPFVFLAVAMVAVTVGGFYVNRRMSETGLAFDKSVLGGAAARKPFRRRRRPKAPPPSP